MIITRSMRDVPRLGNCLKIYNSSWSWVQPKGKETGVKVYNSITRTCVPLILTRNALYWYMCGPTVYSDAHIGHASCYVKFDILRRILENVFHVNVVQVMGMTDIDDKIINRANELKVGFRELAKKYETDFIKDMLDLHVLPPTATVRVSDSITHIIQFIDKLIQQRHAYRATDGSVYFDVLNYGERYGKLIPFSSETDGQHETLENSVKKNAADFALWKAVKPGEPWWESPWGNGRPGWHIECSAIASNVFGSSIDIHTGGIDLMFPHHENELAQSEAYHSVHQWVNYWLHSGHLHFKEEKMSKSLKNTITIQEFLKTHPANVFRIFCLLSHYRNQTHFADNSMDVAYATFKKLESFLSSVKAYVDGHLPGGVINESEVLERLKCCQIAVEESLAEDFNTHQALINILNLVSYTNTLIQSRNDKTVRNPAVVAAVGNYISYIMKTLGIMKDEVKSAVSRSAELENVLQGAMNLRKEVKRIIVKGGANIGRSEKIELLNACDQLRSSLSDSGIKIKDHGVESSWSFENKS